MSSKCKTIMKPKVRFSQASDSDNSEVIDPFQQPQITSVVALDEPVKFIRGVSEQDLSKNRKIVNQSKTKKVSLHSVASAPCLTAVQSEKIPRKPAKLGSIRGRTPKENVVPNEKKNETNPKAKSQVPPNSNKTVANSKRATTSQVKVNSAPPAALRRPQNKPTSRLKSRVQTTIVRNITSQKPNVYVGPGVPRRRTKSLSSALKIDSDHTSHSLDQKLDRPEYNSVIRTIKKLQEVQNQKIVTDVQHLPSAYKNLVMKKASSALDFPAGESIFHDLIDLSIDENQLPLRLTRSKDPQPRQKDLEPTLSDFFVPQYAEEYAESVKVRPRTPELIDDWNPFKISDKIFTWRACLDET